MSKKTEDFKRRGACYASFMSKFTQMSSFSVLCSDTLQNPSPLLCSQSEHVSICESVTVPFCRLLSLSV